MAPKEKMIEKSARAEGAEAFCVCVCVYDPEALAIAIGLINSKKTHGLTKVKKNKTLEIGFIVLLREPTRPTVSKQFQCAWLSSRSDHDIEIVDVYGLQC